MSLFDFFKISGPSSAKLPSAEQDRCYKKMRMQTFLTVTFGYALYYVCRLSMGVMKQPLIDAGLLNATGETVQIHDFTYVSYFWLGAAVISFILSVLNWKRKQQVI